MNLFNSVDRRRKLAEDDFAYHARVEKEEKERKDKEQRRILQTAYENRRDATWEYVGRACYRLKVPGGWLINSSISNSGGCAINILFLKDEHHEWVLLVV